LNIFSAQVWAASGETAPSAPQHAAVAKTKSRNFIPLLADIARPSPLSGPNQWPYSVLRPAKQRCAAQIAQGILPLKNDNDEPELTENHYFFRGLGASDGVLADCSGWAERKACSAPHAVP
jgi:hypothetical protein